ncbi:MAG: flagellar filament capping protein FliD [Deltaproteobacteria bacterium]
MTTRISGLASGMDIDGMVQKMVSAQQTKIDRDKQKMQILEWQQESYRDTNLKLLAFRNTITDLKLPSTFTGKKTTSSDESVIKATATADAGNGTYIIKVNSLYAGVTKISTSELAEYQEHLADQFGITGTISFTLKGKDGVDKVYSFDTTTKSINDVVNAINANAGTTGITAGYSEGGNRFILSTADKGEDAVINLVADGDSFIQNTLKLGMATGAYTGTNASIDYEGATGIEFESNEFALNDINFSLYQTGTAAITVASDIDTPVEKITKFVEAYNAVIENINTKLHETRTYDKASHSYKYMPLTADQKEEMTDDQIKNWETQAKKGIMRNEQILQSLSLKLRNLFNGIMNNNENIATEEGVTLTSQSDFSSYASTLASQFSITGTRSFSLKGVDGVTNTYSFDTATKNMNDVVNAINTNTATSGIVATYSTASNSFSLATVDKTQSASFEIVNDGDLFLKENLKLGVNAGVIHTATNIISGTNANYLTYRSFSSIGLITTEYNSSSDDNGKIQLTESTLRVALANDSGGVMKLFNATQTLLVADEDGHETQQTYNIGLGVLGYDALTSSISLVNNKAGSGSSAYDSSYLGKEILRIEERIADQEERIQELEDYYYTRFTAMEKAIQKANEQSSWLSQQLGQSGNSSQ